MTKGVGIIVCVIGAVILAWFSMESGDAYWIFLIAAALLGVLAGVIKNLPDSRRE